jgi:hypothetical protein
MALIPLTAGCITVAAIAFGHTEQAMRALLKVEGGTVGEVSVNKNGTVDIGPFQINEQHVPMFQKILHADRAQTMNRLRDDGCFNALAAGYILKLKTLAAQGNQAKGMGLYHSATPDLMKAYQERLVRAFADPPGPVDPMRLPSKKAE